MKKRALSLLLAICMALSLVSIPNVQAAPKKKTALSNVQFKYTANIILHTNPEGIVKGDISGVTSNFKKDESLGSDVYKSDVSSNGAPLAIRRPKLTADGAKFIDWYLDPEFTQPFNWDEITVLKDSVVYAKWCVHKNTEIKNQKAATCKEEGYTGDTVCKDCGETVEHGTSIAKLSEHSYDAGKITTEATCAKTGTKTYTCTVCGTTKTEIIPATGMHSYDDGVVTKEPTYTSTGIKTYTCTVCQSTKIETIPMLTETEHTWNEGDIIKAPTTTEEGYIKYICKLCSKEKFVKIPKLPSSTTEEQNSNNNDDNNKPQTEITNESIISAKKVKASISSVKKSGKKIVIKLKKKSGYKYEIKVSTDKKFKKSVKTYKTSKTTYKTGNMKKGKTYYVKVRTYKKINGKTYYGKWSGIKKIKIK